MSNEEIEKLARDFRHSNQMSGREDYWAGEAFKAGYLAAQKENASLQSRLSDALEVLGMIAEGHTHCGVPTTKYQCRSVAADCLARVRRGGE